MRTGTVSASDILAEGARMTGAYHLSEDQVAVAMLRRSRLLTDRLASLVMDRGVFRGPIFRRRYVEDAAYGEPYVSAKDLVMADVRPAGYLSRSHGALLNDLRLHEGMILVTCSGMNLGRAIWARKDLDGLIASHDLIRICPDPSKVPPGYLYAFLSSRYGHAFIRKQIYGGNIKHIEPQHIADLPVPRLGEKVEREVHELVDGAATARGRSALLKRDARRLLQTSLGLSDISRSGTPTSFATFCVQSTSLSRLDAGFHSPSCRAAVSELAAVTTRTHAIAELARVFTPGIFKRKYVDSPAYGYPYFSGTELFQLDAAPRGFLSKKWSGIEGYRVSTDWLLVQDAGQLGGLIGSVVRVQPHFDGSVVSNHLMRIAVRDRETAAYLFVVLTSPHGYRAIIRNAFGSSIPQLDPKQVGQVLVPWPRKSVRVAVAEKILEAWSLEDRAVTDEREGVAHVERAIEGVD